MDATTILLSAISALIGTYAGAYLIAKKGERKIEKIRKLAIDVLNLFKEYAKKKNTYRECNSQFNNNYNIAEKRAILVCLLKLGVPITLPVGTIFNLKKVAFSDIEIDTDEIEDMIDQINKGHCDHLFFMDVDKVFNENALLKTFREMGIKYVNNVLKKSKCDTTNYIINSPLDCFDDFTFSEKNFLQVFEKQLANSMLFTQSGEPDIIKLDRLIEDVQIGLWDNYLLWNHDVYQNVMAQKNIINYLTSASMPQNSNPQTEKK